jgi:hypothetical protein
LAFKKKKKKWGGREVNREVGSGKWLIGNTGCATRLFNVTHNFFRDRASTALGTCSKKADALFAEAMDPMMN